MNLDPFKSPGAPKPKSQDEIFVKSKTGSAGRRAAPTEPSEPMDMSPAEAAPEPEKKKPSVVLRNPKWEAEEVGFNEETEISVELELPEEHAHKTKVTFELFAKTPKGPERISQGDGVAKDGKALCKIPVYIPSFKDEDGNRLQKVEYYFLAKHSEAETLDGSKAPKLVDEMADPFIKSHILPDITFATGNSCLHPREAKALRTMCERIKAWGDDYPDGKLAVFGHADAVGKEADNKALSERRAQSVHAFLTKDVDAWEALYTKEKWGLTANQEYLKHLGHDPGTIDGKDGPKTQAAVKGFQGKQGLPQNGSVDAATRKALFKAFINDINGLKLDKKAFDDINGQATAGCSEFNLAKQAPGACEENRRVAVLLLKSTKNFPIRYPCAKGDIGFCKKQVARKGERRTPGFGCHFYDKLAVEDVGNAGKGVLIHLESSDGIQLPDVAFIAHFSDGTTQKGRLDEKGVGKIEPPPDSTFELEYPDQDDIRIKALSARLAKALDENDAQAISGTLAVPDSVFQAMQSVIKTFFPRPGDLIEEIRSKTKGTEYGDISGYCLAGLGISQAEGESPTEMVAYSEPAFTSEQPGVAIA